MGSVDANRLLEERTLLFAVGVVRFSTTFDRSEASGVIARQLLKSGTAIGANYREANRSESGADFAHKTAIVVKESSETEYWLELCTHVEVGDEAARSALLKESRELLAIFTTINRRARGR